MYEEIIENMKNGDEDALCKLYSVYAQSALRSAYLITNNLHSAQDAVEDTFIQCYNNINKLKNNGAFKVWFYRILTRNACKYAKKDNKNIPVEDENINAGSVNDEYFSNEKYIRLYNAIDSLNEKMKTTVVLFYFNEMSIKEIAKIKIFRKSLKYLNLSNQYLGIEEGMIYTPYELTDQQIQDIEEAISQKENKKVTLKVSIDLSLLGGIKVEMIKKELLRK